ncbi:MAG: molybdenum cofactor guanylyltransferase [Ignavibacteriales bacterium CG_4_9_14_3_um_filter_30_11]|nr:MAG: molybdenum cofactor guanylyltransferase [Ignavibacteriales bacterium CG_4_9_14_3_um_filter_30_11]
MYSYVTGIILAGGKSKRMGENKSFLKLGDKSVIEKITDLMKNIFKNVLLITNTTDEYKFLSIPIYEDIYKYKGPLAGIHSGLTHSITQNNFIISCDIPLMTEKMIKYIVDYKTDKLITVCKADGFIQQLAGRYSKNVLPCAEEIILEDSKEVRGDKQEQRKCNVLNLLDKVGAEIIDAEDLDIYKGNIFFNMNKPEDYKKIINLDWS